MQTKPDTTAITPKTEKVTNTIKFIKNTLNSKSMELKFCDVTAVSFHPILAQFKPKGVYFPSSLKMFL